MWIGIALIITLNGEFVTDASGFKTLPECMQETNRIVSSAQQAKNVIAYKAWCYPLEDLTIKRPPAPAPEAKPESTT